MSSSEVSAANRDLLAVLARLRTAESAASGQELADALKLRRIVHRQLDHDDLRIVDSLDRSGFFTSRNTHPGPGVVELTGCRKSAGARALRMASALFPQSTPSGGPVAPVLPATAAAFGEFTIDLDHAVVIRTLLASAAARRLDPDVWAAAERQLAQWAREYRPEVLTEMGRKLIDGLDYDGAEPDRELDNQTNELHLTKAPDGQGGWLRGRLDSVTFDALVQVIEALIKSRADTDKTLPERQADALGEALERVLDYDDGLPETAGNTPHLTVIIEHEKLKRGLRGTSLTATGCRIGPKEIRRIACASAVIPLLLGGDNAPLDVGREKRTATRYQRAALAVRDAGCAHPGCTVAAKWCQPHHIRHWINGGNTDLNNLVLLCRTHHQMIHHADWQVRIRDHRPEFIPPKWIDPEQKPRRKPQPLLLT